MFTSHTTKEHVTAAFGAGADGYCSKEISVEQVANAIKAVMRGEVWLDPAIANAVIWGDKDSVVGAALPDMEAQILGLIRDGVTNHEIGNRLSMTAERIALVMHNNINRFMEKSADDNKVTVQRPPSHDWLAAIVETQGE